MELAKMHSREEEYSDTEMEVAELLLCLGLRFDLGGGGDFVKWGAKRRRSRSGRGGGHVDVIHQLKAGKSSPQSPLFWCETEESDEPAEYSPAPPLLPQRSTAAAHKNERGRNTPTPTPRKRPPKKKTHKELKEMVNALSLERSRLKKEKEQLLKTYQDLQDMNSHLKSQLASSLDQRREQKQLFTPQPTSSDIDSEQGTETFDDSLTPNEREISENSANTVALSTVVYDEPWHAEKSMYSCSFESSSGSEKGDSSRPAKDPSCLLGLPDLNDPIEATCDVVPHDCHEHMLISRNKVAIAAEARRRRIELTRVKHAQSRKVRSK